MDGALQFPGISNAWTMPIRRRIDMLSTGIRTPVGIKVFGKDLVEIERLAQPDRAGGRGGARHHQRLSPSGHGGYYLDIDPDRDAMARYG